MKQLQEYQVSDLHDYARPILSAGIGEMRLQSLEHSKTESSLFYLHSITAQTAHFLYFSADYGDAPQRCYENMIDLINLVDGWSIWEFVPPDRTERFAKMKQAIEAFYAEFSFPGEVQASQ